MMSSLVARGRSIGVLASPYCRPNAARWTSLYAAPQPQRHHASTAPAAISRSRTNAAALAAHLTPSARASATVPMHKAKELLNPPSYTYAAAISVPKRGPSQSRFTYLYRVGRIYLTFYQTGISHVRQTLKLAKTLRAKVAEHQTARHDGNKRNAAPTDVLSRAEWQVVRRSQADRLRLPAFGILVLLLGEWLPLLALYLTPAIPEACRIPQQVSRDLRKREQRRAERLARLPFLGRRGALRGPGVEGSRLGPQTASSSSPRLALEEMQDAELARVSAQFDCHGRMWDWSLRFVGLAPPTWLLRRSVGRTLTYLNTDDALIRRDGGWAALNAEEVQRACVERGMAVVGKSESEMRRALAAWRGTGVSV